MLGSTDGSSAAVHSTANGPEVCVVLVWSTKLAVTTVFLHEPDETQLVANYVGREPADGEQRLRRLDLGEADVLLR